MSLTIHLSACRQKLEVELPLGKRSTIELSEGGLARLRSLLVEQERQEFHSRAYDLAQDQSARARAQAERFASMRRMLDEAGPATKLPPRGWGSGKLTQQHPKISLEEIGL